MTSHIFTARAQRRCGVLIAVLIPLLFAAGPRMSAQPRGDNSYGPNDPFGSNDPFDQSIDPATANDRWNPHSAAGVPGLSPGPRLTPLERGEVPRNNFPDFAPQIMQTNERLTGPGVSGSTVSVEQLAHPLSKKARKMIEKAQKYSHSGDHAKAIGELRKALEEPSAIPYAHSILGAELLKTGNVKAALQELKEGVLLLPHSVANHSNLGYALFLSGQKEEGEKEIREALKMDSTSPQARFLIGVIQLEKGSHDQEAEKDFQMAQGEVQSAHLGLAMLYGRQGNKSAADQQLLQYLGPERAARLPFARAWLAAALQQGPAATFGFPR